jgi:hypothetical protein
MDGKTAYPKTSVKPLAKVPLVQPAELFLLLREKLECVKILRLD